MSYRMPRLAEDRINLGEVDFLRRLAVIVPERLADFLPPRKKGVMEAPEFRNALPRICRRDLSAAALLQGEKAVDVSERRELSEPWLDRHRRDSTPGAVAR